MFRALIWKDIQLNRLPLALFGGLIIAAYVLAVTQMVTNSNLSMQSVSKVASMIFTAAAFMGYGVSQFSLSVLAGNLVASERVDRSAEFLAYTPASRRSILGAKGVLLAAAALGAMLLHCGLASIGYALDSSASSPGDAFFSTAAIFGQTAAYGFCGAGVGWLASCYLSSNAFAVLFAVTTPLVVPMTNTILLQAIDRYDSLQWVNIAVWCLLGVVGFLWGAIHYLGRVEP